MGKLADVQLSNLNFCLIQGYNINKSMCLYLIATVSSQFIIYKDAMLIFISLLHCVNPFASKLRKQGWRELYIDSPNLNVSYLSICKHYLPLLSIPKNKWSFSSLRLKPLPMISSPTPIISHAEWAPCDKAKNSLFSPSYIFILSLNTQYAQQVTFV